MDPIAMARKSSRGCFFRVIRNSLLFTLSGLALIFECGARGLYLDIPDKISGTVVEAQTLAAIAGALVEVEICNRTAGNVVGPEGTVHRRVRSRATATSDEFGRFELSLTSWKMKYKADLPYSTIYSIAARKSSYDTARLPFAEGNLRIVMTKGNLEEPLGGTFCR